VFPATDPRDPGSHRSTSLAPAGGPACAVAQFRAPRSLIDPRCSPQASTDGSGCTGAARAPPQSLYRL